MFYVYVLVSNKDNKFYIGQTSNLEKRIKEHNAGKVESTKYRRPLELVYHQVFASRKEAVEKEKYYKTYRGREKLKLILKVKKFS